MGSSLSQKCLRSASDRVLCPHMHKHNVRNIADIVEGCVHAHARAYSNACKYNRPSVHACIYVRVCVHAYMHMHVHTQMHASRTAEENAICICFFPEFKGRSAAFLPLCVLPEVAAHTAKRPSRTKQCILNLLPQSHPFCPQTGSLSRSAS